MEGQFWVRPGFRESVREAQAGDEDVQKIVAGIAKGGYPDYEIRNGVLSQRGLLYVPATLRQFY